MQPPPRPSPHPRRHTVSVLSHPCPSHQAEASLPRGSPVLPCPSLGPTPPRPDPPVAPTRRPSLELCLQACCVLRICPDTAGSRSLLRTAPMTPRLALISARGPNSPPTAGTLSSGGDPTARGHAFGDGEKQACPSVQALRGGGGVSGTSWGCGIGGLFLPLCVDPGSPSRHVVYSDLSLLPSQSRSRK